ncbi:MFS transporter [Hydrogenovibrio marinus]|uniref:MFS transporter n=1 Tax=Hydrogenovibrio marinus TaxID=28885 RepID=A0A066ZRI6_HYDMR|nr:MFS transporter [Hydrogenovibrio marinus]KDN96107.1 MFS transporter [Hydrogenovibrio marinus]BBN60717.1 MFS transporter [Hydrogenovibrio marinus]
MEIATFRAFKSRNYRLFFGGQSISLMGTWIQRTAVYWLVYIETHSAFMVGFAVFVTQFPSFLFGLFGGAVADKYNRYQVLLVTQIASMLQASVMTFVVLFTDYTISEILLLGLVLGVINAFDIPARQSLVQFMVDNPDDLGNAIALNSSMVNLARLAGPAVAGILLDSVGAGICFLINALSFIAVLASLMLMKLPPAIPQLKTQKMLESLGEGFSYVRANPLLANLILLLALMSFFVLPALSLLPVVAKETFAGTAATFGYLLSFVGMGSLIGTLFLASLSAVANRQAILVLGMAVISFGLIAFSLTSNLTIAFIFATISGFGIMILTTLTNTLLQTTSSIEMRGRVISYFAMAFFGMQPIGALVVGAISQGIGAQHTIMIEGIIAALLMLIFAPRLKKRPVAAT